MKKTVIALLLSMTVFSSGAQISFGQSEKINNQWKFILSDVANGQNPALDDGKWQPVELPHDWSVKGQLSPSLASCTGYLPGGIAWYRKTLTVPESKENQKVYLYFEGVYNRSEVFVNGHSLGKRPNGYVSFAYDATPYIKYGEDNVIAVRVDHSRSADSRWYTGSGIYRNVWLIFSNPVHIAQWGVFAQSKDVSAKRATVNVSVEVENNTAENIAVTVKNELFYKGKPVSVKSGKTNLAANQKSVTEMDLKVSHPELWNLDNPNLYQLKTTLLKDGEEIDQTVTNTGIRTYAFDADKGFALNGEWMKVKGVCIHHDAGTLGSAVPREVWKRRLQTLKGIGCNAIRTSHNPQSPDLYGLCDELGLLVMNEAFDEWEFAKRKWVEGWNVGTPEFQGTFDFFEEWGEKDLADMVRRDRNHVSVFAWSIGNEVDYPNDPYSHPVLDGGASSGFTQPIFGGYKKDAPDAMRLGAIAKKLAAVVKTYDNSRPVTAGLAGVAMSNETEYPNALDIAGYNYTESRYDSDHKKYPARVIYGSENGHGFGAWKEVRDKDFIFGQFLWTGIDYLGESGRWPSRGFYSGLLDFGGSVKPRGYFRQSLWSDKPMAYIGTYPKPERGNALSQDAWPVWNYTEGQSVRVVCYTNAAQAKLLLNGKTVGETKKHDDNSGIIFWDIPYADGKLEAIGMDREGNQVSNYSVQSSKQPFALTVQSIDNKIASGGLSQIFIGIVDENGISVILSDNEITCRITGPAKLLGLEASNNQDMSDYTDNVQRVFHGKLLAYVQSTGEKGQIKVQFSSPWLKPVEAVIDVE
jgi:beta-galactosidase/beta-glucuronidase